MRTLRFIWTALTLALGAMRRNPLRSGLTSFGIFIGVAAVVIVVALAEGATAAITARVDSMGMNALVVTPRETARSGIRDESSPPPLTEADARALVTEIDTIQYAAPVLQGFAQVRWRDANTATRVVGSNLDYFPVGAFRVRSGELWSESVGKIGGKVVVIGDTVRRELFGTVDPVGRTVLINRHPFRVVGVLEPKGQSPFGQDQDNVLVMPTATMRAKLSPTRPGQVHRILLSATSRGVTERAQRDAKRLLRQRHQLAEGAESDFRIRSQEQFRQIQEGILGVLSLLLLSIAGVSLVVGGIGVMNIMLVSVAERTREIGIRLAIGARENDILVQFLVEAIALSVLGGIGGTLLAGAVTRALSNALGWPMSLSPTALAVALGTATFIGVVFGFVPARRAARMDPIHALRRD